MQRRCSNTLTLMLNVGPGELIAISMVALIVLGPQRLPEALRQVGRFMGEIRKMSTGFQDEIRNAFDDAEVAQSPGSTKTSPAAATAKPIDATASDTPERDTPEADMTAEPAVETTSEPDAATAPDIETATEAPAEIESEDDASNSASTPTESTNDVPLAPGRDAS